MRVRNLRCGLWLAEEVKVARSFLTKFQGLMGRGELAPGHGLLLSPCRSIHSFFMRFPFDAVFLDDERQVLYLMPAMPPFRVSPIVWKAWGVLELPAGTIIATGTRIGDRLEFVG